MVCYLYKITNKINGKIYLGITKNPKTREYKHFACTSKHGLMTHAIQKYGKENFTFEVLCKGSRPYIVDLEQRAILHFNTLTPNGYNIREGGEDCGSGHTIKHRIDDTPICVSGFWFPNRRTAIKSLNINPKSIYRWKNAGTLESEQHLPSDSVSAIPQYVAGFWFDTLYRAADKLNLKLSTLKRRIKADNVEAETRRSKAKLGSKNPMFGKGGELHHNSKPILIDGTIYNSIMDAVRNTNYTKSMIEKRLKKNIKGFEYAQPS